MIPAHEWIGNRIVLAWNVDVEECFYALKNRAHSTWMLLCRSGETIQYWWMLLDRVDLRQSKQMRFSNSWKSSYISTTWKTSDSRAQTTDECAFSTNFESGGKLLNRKGLFEFCKIGDLKKSFKNKALHNYDCIKHIVQNPPILRQGDLLCEPRNSLITLIIIITNVSDRSLTFCSY